jgi:hypothetical protein
MKPLSLLDSLLVLALLAALAPAAPPSLTNLTPRGAQSGVPIVITLSGTGLTQATRLVLPFKASQKLIPDAKPNPALVKLQLTVDASVTPAIYPVRAVNEEGLSALTFFRVDTLPAVAEVEDNNTFEKAQKVTWPIAIDGQCPGGDVDHFRFTARKGQRVVIEVESARLGSAVLPQLRITDDNKRLIASDDSQSLAGDARVIFTAAADGDFIVELSDSRYRGGTPAHYRLRIADYDVPAEVFPLGGRRGETVTFTLRGGTLAKPAVVKRKIEEEVALLGRMLLAPEGLRPGMLPMQLSVGDLPERIVLRKAEDTSAAVEIVPPLVVNGRLDRAGQADRFRFKAAPGSRWRLVVEAESLGSSLDGVLRVQDDKGKQLALVDDVDLPSPAPGLPAMRTVDPRVEVTVPADSKELVLELRDQRRRGGVNFGYRLTVQPIEADFAVGLPVQEVNVPRGGAVALNVPIVRSGYTGPLQLVIPDLPTGLTVQGGNVPAGAVGGVLTISADAKADGEPVALLLEGRATVNGKPLHRPASQSFPVSREAGVAGMLTLRRFLLARTSAVPFQLTAPPPLTLVKGYPVEVPIRLTRSKGQEKLAIQLTSVFPSLGRTGITARPLPATVAAEAKLTLTAGVNAPEGLLDLAVSGRARVGPADVITTTPAVPVTIRPPFEVKMAATRLDVKPGQQLKWSAGTLVRQAVFKEAVQLTLAGLPAGVVLANPLKPLGGMDKDVAIELKVNPKAAPITGKATLTFSTTVGGAVYTHPPVIVEVAVAK